MYIIITHDGKRLISDTFSKGTLDGYYFLGSHLVHRDNVKLFGIRKGKKVTMYEKI